MEANEIKSVTEVFDIIKWDSTRLDNLNKYIDGYEKVFPYGTWFRGQDDSDWPLVPTVFRKSKESNELIYARNEPRLINRFRLNQSRYRQEFKTTFDWLSLMQHYGYPTRILDWSENVLVALYFAALDKPETRGKPGALFVLNTFKLNYLSYREFTHLKPDDLPCWLRAQTAEDPSYKAIRHQIINERPADLPVFDKMLDGKGNRAREAKLKNNLSLPLAVFPYHLHERMSRQQSTFVLHGGTYAETHDFEPPILLDDLNNNTDGYRKFSKKFIIQPDKKDIIRHQLHIMGIHLGSMFPELEYQSQYLKDLWSLKIKYPKTVEGKVDWPK
jgi:hypothetical protein